MDQSKGFLTLYQQQFQIITDFYSLVPEDKYDFRLIDTFNRKSDSIRESFAHVLAMNYVYLDGCKSGVIRFSIEPYSYLFAYSKKQLLTEAENFEKELMQFISAHDFDETKLIDAPWGKTTIMTALFALREHLILHVGWNLAIMDALNIPRFESLKKVWG